MTKITGSEPKKDSKNPASSNLSLWALAIIFWSITGPKEQDQTIMSSFVAGSLLFCYGNRDMITIALFIYNFPNSLLPSCMSLSLTWLFYLFKNFPVKKKKHLNTLKLLETILLLLVKMYLVHKTRFWNMNYFFKHVSKSTQKWRKKCIYTGMASTNDKWF